MGQMTSRGFRATPSTNNDIREALNAAFSFRPTPQSLEASTLLAKNNEVPAEIDFDLHLPLLKSALSQHKKADVIRLMQDLARANAPARAFILQRVERYTKQMEEQMTQAQQKAASSSNAAKISANAKNIDVQQPPSDKEAKEGSPAPSGLLLYKFLFLIYCFLWIFIVYLRVYLSRYMQTRCRCRRRCCTAS